MTVDPAALRRHLTRNGSPGLLADLRRIEEEEHRLRPGERPADFVPQMLAHIGDCDPALRDELIYPTFHAWIEGDRFTEPELRSLLAVLTDEEHLFHGIGGEGDRSVFTRTFSMLVVALLLRRHHRASFLAPDEYAHVRNALLRYHREERDLRGLVGEYGWAHAAAHGADALVELVLCPESDRATHQAVLDALRTMLHNGSTIFPDEDDERMATVVDALVEHGLLPEAEIVDWLERLTDCADQPRSRGQVTARVNTKNFLRSLHFRRPRSGPVADAVLAGEARVNRFTAR